MFDSVISVTIFIKTLIITCEKTITVVCELLNRQGRIKNICFVSQLTNTKMLERVGNFESISDNLKKRKKKNSTIQTLDHFPHISEFSVRI